MHEVLRLPCFVVNLVLCHLIQYNFYNIANVHKTLKYRILAHMRFMINLR